MSLVASPPLSARSHRSSSLSSTSSLQLDPSTLAALDSFYAASAELEHQFSELQEAASAAQAHEDARDAAPIDVDKFRELFREDWQVSQFWYSTVFANRLAAFISTSFPSPTTRIVFLCSPTAFVAFQHQYPERREAVRLLEYDGRFELVAGRRFIRYDLDQPDTFPEDLRASVDVAVVDPPFLNEITNRKIAQTLSQILHPTRGRVILLTSTSVSDILPFVYTTSPLGPLFKTGIQVEHQNNLGNEFGVWTSWESGEDGGIGALADGASSRGRGDGREASQLDGSGLRLPASRCGDVPRVETVRG